MQRANSMTPSSGQFKKKQLNMQKLREFLPENKD